MSVIPSSTATSLARNLRERQRAPPLDYQLDDVARQHEHERRQHRDVGHRERVQHDFDEEVGRVGSGAVRDREQRGERADEQQDPS